MKALDAKLALIAQLQGHVKAGETPQALACAGGLFVGLAIEAGMIMGQGIELFQEIWLAARKAAQRG